MKSLTGTISAGTEVASAAAAAVVVVVVGVVIVVLVMEVAWGGGGGGRESAITLTLPSPTKPPSGRKVPGPANSSWPMSGMVWSIGIGDSSTSLSAVVTCGDGDRAGEEAACSSEVAPTLRGAVGNSVASTCTAGLFPRQSATRYWLTSSPTPSRSRNSKPCDIEDIFGALIIIYSLRRPCLTQSGREPRHSTWRMA